MEELYLQLHFNSQVLNISLHQECEKVEMVTVWSDSFLAGIKSDEINSALSKFLNQKVKLARYQTGRLQIRV